MEIIPWYKKEVRYLGKDYKNIFALMDDGIEVIPFHVARQLLAPITWQEFIDLLNIPSTDGKHLVTEAEEDFRDHERQSPGVPFFRKREIADSYVSEISTERREYMDRFFNIEFDEFDRWVANNPDMLPESRVSKEPVFVKIEEVRTVISIYQQRLAKAEAALDHSATENEKLKTRIAELEKASQNGAESEEIASLPTNIKTVLRMLQEQKSDREIAQALYNGGGNSGMSQAQVKALLWRGDEFPAEQSIKNAMKELFLPA